MSGSHLVDAWTLDGVTPVEKLVLMYLGDNAGFDDRSHLPPFGILAQRSSAGEDEIRRVVFSLAERGYIRLEPPFTKGEPPQYRMTLGTPRLLREVLS